MTKEFSLKKLMTYQGTGERPNDFDHFWNNQIKMLDDVALNVTITPALDVEFEHFTVSSLMFTSFDGARIHAKYMRPKTSEKVPCVMQFHGYPGSSRPFFEHASFVDAQMAVIAMDCRGQGGYSEDIGGILGTSVGGHLVAGVDDRLENMLYVKIYSDAYLLSLIVMNQFNIDANQIYVNGASQGAALAIVCAALNPKIKKATILYPFLSDFERVFDLGYDLIAYEGLRYYSRWFDPEGRNKDKLFARLAYIDTRHFASRIQCEVLFGISMADTVCPISTQFAVYNNLKCKKKLVRYLNKGHEPIYAFDDLILPFYNKSNYNNEIKHKNEINYQFIQHLNKKLIIQIQPEIPFGIHYLRRYTGLGYDVLAIEVKDMSNRKKINADISELIQQIDNENYQSIILVAEDKRANLALTLALKMRFIKALILQTPVKLSMRVIKQSNQLQAFVLLGLGGLDEVKNRKLNQKFYRNLDTNKQINLYPKYGKERINAFEDQKLIFLNDIKQLTNQ